MVARSYLYVPGDRPDRFDSALRRDADAIILDLEDAVRPAAKDFARAQIVKWLATLNPPHPPIWVRINPGDQGAADIAAVAASAALVGLCVAKTETRDELNDLDRQLSHIGADLLLAPLIESATAIENIRDIARGPRVHVLHIGEIDLAADLDVIPSPDGRELAYVRTAVVIASRAAGLLPPVAPVGLELQDMTEYERMSRELRRTGFFGRACLHPRQVEVANRVHSPSSADVTWAENILARATTEATGVFVDEAGAMVDEAVLRRARRIIALRL